MSALVRTTLDSEDYELMYLDELLPNLEITLWMETNWSEGFLRSQIDKFSMSFMIGFQV